MTPPQGLASFPGIQQLVRATYTRSHGITPGVAMLEIAPQAHFVAVGGDLAFTFDRVLIPIPNCKVDKHSLRTDASGQVWALTILDRRWKWAFGELSGHYNERKDDGTIDSATQATPQQLATLCLTAMGEQGFTVSQMPNDPRPLTQWEAQNPAQALAALCETLGCRVVLQLDDTVAVCRTGQGAELPVDGTVQENSLTIDPPERPDSLKVVCGKTRYETDFTLEAVGEDVDGSVKPIDQLSYRPAAGWAVENPLTFAGVTAVPLANGIIPQTLALHTVYRWYRITTQDPRSAVAGVPIPGYPRRITDLTQVLPIEDVLVQTAPGLNGQPQSKPAEVYGSFWNITQALGYNNLPPGSRFEGSFTIRRDQGLVEFATVMTKIAFVGPANQQAANFFPAAIALRVAVSVKDPATRAWVRANQVLVYPGGQWFTGPRILFHDEIVRNVWPAYDANNNPTGTLNDNAPAVAAECTYYLAAADLEYQTHLPYEIAYAGLRAINPDGAIQQVTWSVGSSGATTRASRNDEFSGQVPSYKERRLRELLRAEELKKAVAEVQQARARKEP